MCLTHHRLLEVKNIDYNLRLARVGKFGSFIWVRSPEKLRTQLLVRDTADFGPLLKPIVARSSIISGNLSFQQRCVDLSARLRVGKNKLGENFKSFSTAINICS